MLPGISRAAENDSVFSCKAAVAFLIVTRVAVDAFSAGAAVRKAGIFTQNKFPAVGLEPVYAQLQQILPFIKNSVLDISSASQISFLDIFFLRC